MRRPTIYTKVAEPHAIRVVIPYTKPSYLLQTVVDCIRIQQVQPTLYKVGSGDEYWRLLRDLWGEGEDFYVVEQDVIVWQGAFRALSDCAGDWCTLPTMCHGRMITTTFGCVAFKQRLIERHPDMWEDIPTTWFHLDANFADKMGWPYIRPHDHWPPATHVNEVQWPDEVSQRFTLERKMVWQSMEAGGDAVVRAGNTEDKMLVGTVSPADARKGHDDGDSPDRAG